jgi:hypothetical protein
MSAAGGSRHWWEARFGCSMMRKLKGVKPDVGKMTLRDVLALIAIIAVVVAIAAIVAVVFD